MSSSPAKASSSTSANDQGNGDVTEIPCQSDPSAVPEMTASDPNMYFTSPAKASSNTSDNDVGDGDVSEFPCQWDPSAVPEMTASDPNMYYPEEICTEILLEIPYEPSNYHRESSSNGLCNPSSYDGANSNNNLLCKPSSYDGASSSNNCNPLSYHGANSGDVQTVPRPPTGFPVGFRFVPEDYQLVNYLTRKLLNMPLDFHVVNEVEIYNFHPRELVAIYREWAENGKLYFFTQRERKHINGTRPDRTTPSGYWKATGSDIPVKDKRYKVVGKRKLLVYHKGKSGKGLPTEWVMHEYTKGVETSPPDGITKKMDEWVLCTILLKRGAANKAIQNHSEKQEGSQQESLSCAKEVKACAQVHQAKKCRRAEQTCQQEFDENIDNYRASYGELNIDPNFNSINYDAWNGQYMQYYGQDMLYDESNYFLESSDNIATDVYADASEAQLFPLPGEFQNYQTVIGSTSAHTLQQLNVNNYSRPIQGVISPPREIKPTLPKMC